MLQTDLGHGEALKPYIDKEWREHDSAWNTARKRGHENGRTELNDAQHKDDFISYCTDRVRHDRPWEWSLEDKKRKLKFEIMLKTVK